ncbi:MAG TPA: monovalent cation/H+ antiporter complex subunit F [Actinomycetota bacterium]|nr:monovalent cation/H+ antiporter complex subunit F [Actinomycetota bacterium]
MTAWMIASAVLAALLLPCGVICLRDSTVDRLLGLELGGAIGAMTLLTMSEAFDRSPYADLALVFAAVSFAATLMIARFVEGQR